MSTPFFSKFGKKASDLFKANKFDKNIEVVNQAADGGPKVTTTGVANPGKPFSGKMKFELKDKNFGSEFEVGTCGALSGKLTLNSLLDNLKVTIEGAIKKGLITDSISAEYTYEDFAFTAALSGTEADDKGKKADKSSAFLAGSAAWGEDGFAVGGSAKFKVAEGTTVSPQTTPVEYQYGVSYTQADFQGAFTAKNDDFNLRYFHKVSATHRMGAQFVAKPSEAGVSHSLGFCSEFDANDSTVVKTTAGTCGLVVHQITHRLANPAVKLTGSAGFKVTAGDVFNISPGKLDQLGLKVSLGDF